MTNKYKKATIIILLFIIPFFIISYFLFFDNEKETITEHPGIFLNINSAWADTTLKYLSFDEKISQLIIYDIGIVNNKNKDSVLLNFKKIFPGGIIFQTDSLKNYILFLNKLQKTSKIKLLAGIKSKKTVPLFKDVIYNPDFFSLMSVKDDSIIKKYIKTLATINKKINTSFCILPEFPLKNKDSLLIKKYSDLISLFNYELKNKNILSFSRDSNINMLDSLKYQKELKMFDSEFKGIVVDFNNNSNIKSITNYKGFEISNIKNNILNIDSVLNKLKSGTELFITAKPGIFKKIILQLIAKKKISETDINKKVRKILLAKTWTYIKQDTTISKDSILYFFKNKTTKKNIYSVIKNSVCLVKNKNNYIPFDNIRNKRFEIIEAGIEKLSNFNKTFKNYTYFKSSFLNIKDKKFIQKLTNLKKSSHLILLLNKIEIDTLFLKALLTNNKTKSITLVNFGNANNLRFSDNFNSVIQVYGNSKIEQKYAADAIFGGIRINGQLSQEINDSLKFGTRIKTKKIRIAKAFPEEEGLNSEVLLKIDSIAKNGIRKGAFPGCQIVVLKNGNCVYEKSFGYHTYLKRKPVRKTDLYDLASITKIVATTNAAMMLFDKGKLRLNHKLGRFFKDTRIDYSNIKPDTLIHSDTLKYAEISDFKEILKTGDTIRLNDSMFIASYTVLATLTPKNNIFNVEIKDILLHKSGISPVLPILPYVLYKKNFYDSLEVIKAKYYEKLKTDTLENDSVYEFNEKHELEKVFNTYFSHKYVKDSSEIKIAENIYFKNNYFDTLWQDTKRLRVHSKKFYKYSDINMILLQTAIDSLNRRSIDKYLKYRLYNPMGLRTMCYKPLNIFNKNRIIPTEDEKYWRNQILTGNVHDPSSAMLGQVAGNAGLFSNAFDLATIGQMWLNGGTYGGKQFIKESTIKKFSGFQEDSHRGLGFDKPTKKTIISKKAPRESYGHTGFTGTCIWIDPVNDIVFVFLSNRVHPNQKNWRINKLKIRQKIHTVVYDAIKK